MAVEAAAAPEVRENSWSRATSAATTDEELLGLFVSRTDESVEAAFGTLVERHGPMVHRVCRDVLGCRHEAQDAAQAVFLVLARKARSIRKPESLGPWLHGVALRVARRAKCEVIGRRIAEARKAEIMQQRNTAEIGPEPMDYAELHEEVDRLPEKYRQPIILCYMQGQTQAQAAVTLGWPLGTVQVRLHRGRERLRSRLARRCPGLIAPNGSVLIASLSARTGALEREWTDTTARAAVRFAAGKGLSGLVAPAVSGLARSVLAAMFGESVKLVAFIATALLLAVFAVSRIGPAIGQVGRDVPFLEARRTSAASQLEPAPTSNAPIPKALGEVVHKEDRSTRRVVEQQEKRRPIERPATSAEGTPTVIPRPRSHPVDDLALLALPAAPYRSRSPALGDGRSKKTLKLGRELFEKVWVRNDPGAKGGDGLGPVFNGQSCLACHNLGGSGGAGAVERNIEIATATDSLGEYTGFSYSFSMDFGAGRFEYRIGGGPQATSRREPRGDPRLLAMIHPGFQEARSVMLHRYGIDPAYSTWRESVPGRHGSIAVRSSQRNAPALFGAGLIDAIPDFAIEAAAKRKSPGLPQVKGRVSRLKDGRIGRFGWKAQTATLEEFVLSAAALEIGLEVPGRHQAADPRLPGLAATGLDMDEAECDLLVDYVRSLPVPVAMKPADQKDAAQRKAGESNFKTIGCTACHLPKLGEVEGIYSDLLLHDMGQELGDSDTYIAFLGQPRRPDAAADLDRAGAGAGAASAREWRTPPLWGLRDSGPYLHDGRAANIAQAVTLHAGQAAAAARRYSELSPRRKQQLEAFLTSLAAPPAGP